MFNLSSLKNTSRPKKKVQRIGRGMGSKRGKTCCRGVKGDKARQGYKTRDGHEGGQMPLYRKLPCRGFSHERFRDDHFAINLEMIDFLYRDGEIVTAKTLREKGYGDRRATAGLKILGTGELKKKVSIEAQAFSKTAEEKLAKHSISYKTVALNS